MIHRVALSLLGSYVFSWGFTSLGIALLVACGLDFHTAETAVLLLAFLVFVPVFLWAFSDNHLGRVWVVLVGVALVMTIAAWCLQNAIL